MWFRGRAIRVWSVREVKWASGLKLRFALVSAFQLEVDMCR